MKCWSDRQNDIQHPNSINAACNCMDSTSSDDNEAKFKAMASLTIHAPILEDANDRVGSEKSQLSGFMSPQMSCMNSFIDKSSESIPLYHVKVDNKRTVGTTPASDSSLPYNTLGFSSSSLLWMDPVNKSFSLESSITAPKLVSGSVYVGNGPGLLRRVVNETEDRETDETTYNVSKFPEMGVSDRIKSSTPSMDNLSTSSETSELSSLAWSSTITDSGWRPRGGVGCTPPGAPICCQ